MDGVQGAGKIIKQPLRFQTPPKWRVLMVEFVFKKSWITGGAILFAIATWELWLMICYSCIFSQVVKNYQVMKISWPFHAVTCVALAKFKGDLNKNEKKKAGIKLGYGLNWSFSAGRVGVVNRIGSMYGIRTQREISKTSLQQLDLQNRKPIGKKVVT